MDEEKEYEEERIDCEGRCHGAREAFAGRLFEKREHNGTRAIDRVLRHRVEKVGVAAACDVLKGMRRRVSGRVSIGY